MVGIRNAGPSSTYSIAYIIVLLHSNMGMLHYIITLHHCNSIISYTGTDSVYLHNISVTPVTLQTALLRWNITPSNVVHCIPNYTIKCIGGNGTEWKTETPNSRLSYMAQICSGIRLLSYCSRWIECQSNVHNRATRFVLIVMKNKHNYNVLT